MRIFPAVNLRFPEEGSSAQGQSGANARPKGVADAHPANSPQLPGDRYHDGGTQEARQAWIGSQDSQVEARRGIQLENPLGHIP